MILLVTLQQLLKPQGSDQLRESKAAKSRYMYCVQITIHGTRVVSIYSKQYTIWEFIPGKALEPSNSALHPCQEDNLTEPSDRMTENSGSQHMACVPTIAPSLQF